MRRERWELEMGNRLFSIEELEKAEASDRARKAEGPVLLELLTSSADVLNQFFMTREGK